MVDLQRIQSKIYEIRGHKVMINRDLAELYQVTTGNLNKSVQRNIKRFPSDFMFQLTKEEFDQLKTNLIFQNGISNWGGTRKLPYAFTEQGPAMLSGISNSDTAIQVNINIMRAFVAMRRLISNPPVDKNAELREEMKKLKGRNIRRPERHQRRHPHTTRTYQSDTGRIAGTSEIVRQTAPPYRFYPPGRRLIEFFISS